jgi:hypothetical protein
MKVSSLCGAYYASFCPVYSTIDFISSQLIYGVGSAAHGYGFWLIYINAELQRHLNLPRVGSGRPWAPHNHERTGATE